MINRFSVMFILLLLGQTISIDEHIKQSSYIDLIIEDYVNQEWNTEESVCFKKTLAIMNNVKNSTLWATWIWDSMQSPVGLLYGSKHNLGNYDECLRAPWSETHPEYRTQYCLANIKISNKDPSYTSMDPEGSVEKYINSKSKQGVKFNAFTWGVCVPAECQPESVSKFIKSLMRNNYLGYTISTSEIKIDSCQRADSSPEFTTKFYASMFFMVVMAVAVVMCTAINYKCNKNGNRLIKAFCMETNLSSLQNSSGDDIKAMHGLRFIASANVVILHLVHITVFLGTNNMMEIDGNMRRHDTKMLGQVTLVVDTFLMMSGLLLTKSYMDSGRINLFTAILKRYIRLVVFIWLILVPVLSITTLAGDGPLYSWLLKEDLKRCNDNLWITLLMLGNYVDTTNMCYPVIWSVPCDFHLSVVGIILIWLFKKNKKIGILTFLALGVASIILPGYVTYQLNLRGLPVFDIGNMIDYRKVLLTNPTYCFSHLRAGSYFIGIAAGYLLFVYNPSKRKLIPKFWSTVGFVIAVSVAIKTIIMSKYIYEKSTFPTWEDVLYASLSRPIWALAMISIIVCCEYGTVPFVGELLKWRFFTPLSKLSYGLYLLHAYIYMYTRAITRNTITMNTIDLLSNAIWVIPTSCAFSFLLYIFYEAPIIKTLNIIIDKRSGNSCKSNGIEKSDRNVTQQTLENKTKIM